MPLNLKEILQVKTEIEIEAPPTVAANFGRVEGTPHVFLANFGGLVPSKVAVPTPAAGIRVRIPAALGDALAYLSFLGKTQILHGMKQGERLEFALPAVERGAVVWVVQKK